MTKMELIREYDERGVLKSAGYQWSAPENQFWITLTTWTIVLGMFGTCISLLLFVQGVGGPVTFFSTFVFFGVLVWSPFANRHKRWIRRRLLFNREGPITAPDGISIHREFRFKDNQTGIRSIEAHGEYSRAYVRLYWTNGNTTTISGGLSQDVAHKVATQLNIALTELRNAIADAERNALAAQETPQSSGQSRNRVID